ncbi:Microtubule-associated protein TORTIFOLIA1 [Camellia lanceoleosa]|uniref:Microtubule-associated protein TORTIFOLIA1 n=1 Tax=Camellia lanceoleosa TaxID=1840588 RepID=A0ACC0HKF2_9ERIC|nr:Microtubule-associated protein TORTIFOLIA1 [Camellia lanceoleosa]
MSSAMRRLRSSSSATDINTSRAISSSSTKSSTMSSQALKSSRSSKTPNQFSRSSSSALFSHLAMFELKQRILTSLSKLPDRDTHQIAVEDLEKIIQNLYQQSKTPTSSRSTTRRFAARLAPPSSTLSVASTSPPSFGSVIFASVPSLQLKRISM